MSTVDFIQIDDEMPPAPPQSNTPKRGIIGSIPEPQPKKSRKDDRERGALMKRWMFTINNPTPEEILNPIPIEECEYRIYGKEHFGGEGTPHLQGFVSLHKRMRLTGVKNLNKRAHWDACSGTAKQASLYCQKGDQSHEEWVLHKETGPNFGKNAEFFEYGDLPIEGGARRTQGINKESQKKQIYADMADAPNQKAAMEILLAEDPEGFFRYGQTIRNNLAYHMAPVYQHDYNLDDFNHPKLFFPQDKCILIYGDTNLGKTKFILAHFKNPLVVRHKDKLKKFKPEVHDAILFDDMSFKHWPAEAVINLLDTGEDSDIDVKCGMVTIPKGTMKVFSHNTYNPFYPLETDVSQREAIERRLKRVHIQQKLYGNAPLPLRREITHDERMATFDDIWLDEDDDVMVIEVPKKVVLQKPKPTKPKKMNLSVKRNNLPLAGQQGRLLKLKK